MELSKLIGAIQLGDTEQLGELMERFNPLVIAWLRKTGELYQKDRDDLQSMAKIILLEAVKDYDPSKGVPFQSFYKLRLWNWYGNYRRKRKIETISLEAQGEVKDKMQDKNMIELIIEEEKREVFNHALIELNETEQKIILRICEGFTISQIAEEIQLEAQKVSKIKYQALNKLKKTVKKCLK